MLLELFRHLEPSSLLNMEHDPESFPGLVRTELIDQMMHVNEKEVAILDLFLSL